MSRKSMFGDSICFTEATPLLPSLRVMVDDEVPRNQSSIAAANLLLKDIPMVTTIVTV